MNVFDFQNLWFRTARRVYSYRDTVGENWEEVHSNGALPTPTSRLDYHRIIPGRVERLSTTPSRRDNNRIIPGTVGRLSTPSRLDYHRIIPSIESLPSPISRPDYQRIIPGQSSYLPLRVGWIIMRLSQVREATNGFAYCKALIPWALQLFRAENRRYSDKPEKMIILYSTKQYISKMFLVKL